MPPRPEWAAHIAQQVVNNPNLVDKELYAQAYSYNKLITSLISSTGLSQEQAAQQLHKQRYRLHGWSKSIVQEVLGIDTPIDTPTWAQKVLNKNITGPEFVSKWNKVALRERLVKSVKAGPYDPIPMSSFYSSISARAKKYGIEQDLLNRLGKDTPSALRSALTPTPKTSSLFKSLTKASTGSLRGFGSFLSSNKWKIGAGVALAGIYTTKPFSIFGRGSISGNDDDYNTITGLPEQGYASQLRKLYTDFGSGYRGILSISKVLSPLFKEAGIGAQSVAKKDLSGFLQSTVAKSLKSGGYASTVSAEQRNIINKELTSLIQESSKSQYSDIILMNIPALKEKAAEAGYSFSSYLKGTIRHERFHQTLTQSGQRESLLSEVAVPSVFAKQIKSAYKQQGLKISEQDIKEEFLAHSITSDYTGRKISTLFDKDVFVKGRQYVSQIEQKLGRQFLKRKQNLQSGHNQAVQQASQYGLRPGRGHLGK